MKILTSQEEILLLAVLTLGENAYGVMIRRYVSEATGREWSIGAVYDPMYRLEDKGHVRSRLIDPTAERGGRSKRVFTITAAGREALVEHRRIRETLWDGVPGLATEGGVGE